MKILKSPTDYIFYSVCSSYKCKNDTKKTVYSKDRDFYESIVVLECLYNGRWNHDINEYACNVCEKPPEPPNGKFKCESFYFQEHSTCTLVINFDKDLIAHKASFVKYL